MKFNTIFVLKNVGLGCRKNTTLLCKFHSHMIIYIYIYILLFSFAFLNKYLLK